MSEFLEAEQLMPTHRTNDEKTQYTPPKSKEYSPKEVEVINWIKQNKKTPSEIFEKLIKSKRVILVGESHLNEHEPIRDAVAASLLELQENGLTHVALEMDSRKQAHIDSLNYSLPNIRKDLEKIAPAGWGDGNIDILIMAKQLGLKVLLINYDDDRPDLKKNDAHYQNRRDEHMTDIITSSMDQNSKCLVFIGSRHVHKSIVEKERVISEKGKHLGVKRLGARLSEYFGNQNIASIRALNRTSNFDGLLGFMSNTPTVEDVSRRGIGEVVVLPDGGPIKGDSRVTDSDFVITTIDIPKIRKK